MIKKRLFSLDMMKFMAALMITNSHFQPLYEGVNTAFATFGVQGNALFFFVVGYLLMMGGHAPFRQLVARFVLGWNILNIGLIIAMIMFLIDIQGYLSDKVKRGFDFLGKMSMNM